MLLAGAQRENAVAVFNDRACHTTVLVQVVSNFTSVLRDALEQLLMADRAGVLGRFNLEGALIWRQGLEVLQAMVTQRTTASLCRWQERLQLPRCSLRSARAGVDLIIFEKGCLDKASQVTTVEATTLRRTRRMRL